jgi:hypothetical protein
MCADSNAAAPVTSTRSTLAVEQAGAARFAYVEHRT